MQDHNKEHNKGREEPCPLQQEMHYLAERLNLIGTDGDCAYERALAQRYRQRLLDLVTRQG